MSARPSASEPDILGPQVSRRSAVQETAQARDDRRGDNGGLAVRTGPDSSVCVIHSDCGRLTRNPLPCEIYISAWLGDTDYGPI